MRTIILNLIALTLFSISIKGQFLTSPTKDNTLVVEGIAIIKEIPNDILAVITVKAESQNYAECQDKLLNRIGIAKSSILRQNINKDLIKTNEITINEKDEYVDGKREKTGFIGSISLSIETPFSPDFAGKLLTALKIDSLGVEYNIKFKLSEDQKFKLRSEAITLAVADAKEKAMILAKSSNIKLIKINSISYLDEGSIFDLDRDIVIEELHPRNVSYAIIGSPNEMAQNIDFNPKEVGIYKSVLIEWKIAEVTK
jgi:uncharacterized protein